MPIQRNNLSCKPKEITSKKELRSENQFLKRKLANQVKLVRQRLSEGPTGSLLSGRTWRAEPILKVETLACESLYFAFKSLIEVCLCRLEEVGYIFYIIFYYILIIGQQFSGHYMASLFPISLYIQGVQLSTQFNTLLFSSLAIFS
ncbi:Hypothetical_protein [Hexamita inflata]|uniref:Hypothetical_protein n=1 Tax=Hexamita inflata TaxID=28002 RepID=A0AA86TBR5_9EUKA|nr:Hypothetical protein HINF_LOCUS1126 [Hexamita inflata]